MEVLCKILFLDLEGENIFHYLQTIIITILWKLKFMLAQKPVFFFIILQNLSYHLQSAYVTHVHDIKKKKNYKSNLLSIKTNFLNDSIISLTKMLFANNYWKLLFSQHSDETIQTFFGYCTALLCILVSI